MGGHRFIAAVVFGASWLAGSGAPAAAQFAGLTVVSGLSRPVFVTAPPGDFRRLFVVEKGGAIKVVDTTTNPLPTVLSPNFLTITVTGNANASDERGLLGLAFHPNYRFNGRLFINYTATNGTGQLVTRIAEVINRNPATLVPTPSANTADPASLRVVMEFVQPQNNHNGGWMGFGPDGNLYISTGDGGGAYDDDSGHVAPGGNGQAITTPLGKMLRINVDGVGFAPSGGQIGGVPNGYLVPGDNPFVGATAGLDEIWAFGLRNAWRPSFDRATGDLWIADVGQDWVEEINVQPALTAGNAASVRGRNYGWRCFEGTVPVPNGSLAAGFNNNACPSSASGAGYTAPVGEYLHAAVTPPATPQRLIGSFTGCSITGGYVYRGCGIPSLQGQYLFTDYCTGRIYRTSLPAGGSQLNAAVELPQVWPSVASPGIPVIARPAAALASFGEDAYGELYIVDQPGGRVFKVVPTGGGRVVLGNTDADRNGFTNVDDIFVFLNLWFALASQGDYDRSGAVTLDDIFVYLNDWFRGSCPF
jgi:glucose/arabinose dehydrogenase